MIYRKIDINGYFIEDIIFNEPPMVDVKDNDGNITKQPHPHYIAEAPIGFIYPRYVNGEWVEAVSEQDIENLKIPQRLADIKAQLKALDIKTYKFIDGELTEKEYAPFKLEKIALRKEYNALEVLHIDKEPFDLTQLQPVDDVIEQVVDDVVDDFVPIEEQTNYSYEDIEAAKNMDVVEDLEKVEETDSTDEDTETTFSE
jgi:hypothetical protein